MASRLFISLLIPVFISGCNSKTPINGYCETTNQKYSSEVIRNHFEFYVFNKIVTKDFKDFGLSKIDGTYANVEAFETVTSFPNDIGKLEYRVRKTGNGEFYYSDYMSFPYNIKNDLVFFKIYTDVCLESTWISEGSFSLDKDK